MAGESEVKAQIKLRFITPNDQPVVIIRSFLVRPVAPCMLMTLLGLALHN